MHKDGCLALQHSPAAGADDTDRTDGPVMAGHVGDLVRFTGSEVVLGRVGSQGVIMPPSCRVNGTRVLLVTH